MLRFVNRELTAKTNLQYRYPSKENVIRNYYLSSYLLIELFHDEDHYYIEKSPLDWRRYDRDLGHERDKKVNS